MKYKIPLIFLGIAVFLSFFAAVCDTIHGPPAFTGWFLAWSGGAAIFALVLGMSIADSGINGESEDEDE